MVMVKFENPDNFTAFCNQEFSPKMPISSEEDGG
jgi:hypothetical protein